MEISPPGEGPVARFVKPGKIGRRLAYDIFTGPGLSELSGHLTACGALERDGAVIGIVNPSHGRGRVPDAEIHPMEGLPYGKRTIHDERIDRKLPLAALAAIGQCHLASPGAEAVGAANIARRLLRRRKVGGPVHPVEPHERRTIEEAQAPPVHDIHSRAESVPESVSMVAST
jgi:hypothetical protein